MTMQDDERTSPADEMGSGPTEAPAGDDVIADDDDTSEGTSDDTSDSDDDAPEGAN